jgi:hypothetical protein
MLPLPRPPNFRCWRGAAPDPLLATISYSPPYLSVHAVDDTFLKKLLRATLEGARNIIGCDCIAEA